jgi:hypothetical protein
VRAGRLIGIEEGTAHPPCSFLAPSCQNQPSLDPGSQSPRYGAEDASGRRL